MFYTLTIDRKSDFVKPLTDVPLDKIFTDKASGKDIHRPELKRCLEPLRKGDVLHVHSFDRLARNLKDLQNLVENLTAKGVTIKFHKENLTFEGNVTASPMQTLMLQMMGAFAEFERSMIRERQREGIAAAKAKGKKLAKEFGISRPTLYKIAAV